MSLRDMIKRLKKAAGHPKIEIPENTVIVPPSKQRTIVGIDYGTGPDQTGMSIVSPKSGESIYGANPIQLSVKSIQAKKLQTQWNLSTEMLGTPAEPHKTIEEALRHRHVKSKRLTENNIFDDASVVNTLMKNMTDRIAADIESTAINGSPTFGDNDTSLDTAKISSAIFTPRVLTNIPRSAMWNKVATDFKGKRGHDSIEAALRMRHRKDDFGPPSIEAIQSNLIYRSEMSVQALPKSKFFPMLDIDTLWIK